MPRLLNLGCGDVFHPDWVNLELAPKPPHVLGCDLRRGIPYPDGLFDAVYHSHVLEHLTRHDAAIFIRECLRVLAPGGTLRVAAPDLENIARAYLAALDEARRGEPEADERHEWMVVELVDQLTRHERGGEMARFWKRDPVPVRDFILSRVGMEARRHLDAPRKPENPPSRNLDEFNVGRFRLSGECHLWMYDGRSLSRLLRDAGFEDVRVAGAAESAIPDFARYGLDLAPDGLPRKPDSMYLEARKPEGPGVDFPRVVGFCMKDSGGAGGAAHRLHEGLASIDVPSFLYVAQSGAPSPGVAVIPASGTATLTCDEAAGTLTHSGWTKLFADSRARLAAYPGRPQGCEIFTESATQARISDIAGMDAADIIQLHWIAGTVDVCRDVEFLRGRPIVWTLHDLNPFTGGCHYAEGCLGFERYCGRCPQLGSSEENDYSREQWLRKKAAYRELDITVVCPSRWLAELARRSTLFRKAAVHVIPNGAPTDVFKPLNRAAIRRALEIPEGTFTVLFGADYLKTRRKGYAELAAALELLRDASPEAPLVLTFGNADNADLGKLPVRRLHLGTLHDPTQVAMAYNAADCLALPSLEDNLPNMALEALACGLPVAGFATGGIPDMVTDGETGRLAPTGDCRELAACIAWLRDLPEKDRARMRMRCRETVLTRFTLPHQARAYAALYRELLQARA